MYAAYAQALGWLRPGDRDGDGVRDGCEIFCQTDPKDPYDHPRIILYQFPGFQAFDPASVSDTSYDERLKGDPGELGDVLLQPGERRHMQFQLSVLGIATPFAAGTKVFLIPPKSAWLCPGRFRQNPGSSASNQTEICVRSVC
jgi:hypothetical protein